MTNYKQINRLRREALWSRRIEKVGRFYQKYGNSLLLIGVGILIGLVWRAQ